MWKAAFHNSLQTVERGETENYPLCLWENMILRWAS